MAYGLQTFNAAGALTFDSDRALWRYIDSFDVGATESSSRTYSDYNFLNLAIITIPHYESSGGHIFTVSGTTISWTYFSGPAPFTYTTTPETVKVFGA